jgi:putative oxidoreductase
MKFNPRHALFVTRVIVGLVFWQHGLEKLFGFAGARPEPTLWGIRGVAAILEAVGGPMLALGLFVRPVAFILSGEMAVAYFRAWAPRGFFPIANGGEEATLNAFVFLWLAAAGAGAFGLDALIERRGAPVWRRLAAWEPRARSLLQWIVGLLMVLHGSRALFGVLTAVAGRRNAPTLALDALPHAFGYIELLGGVLLILGVAVRSTSVVLALQALLAYVVMAMPRGRWPVRNGGNEALLYFAAFLYLAVAGSGAFAPARWWRRKSPSGRS